MRMAKLLMVAGDMAGARGLLRELAERSDQVRPAPSVLLQDEAKYFMVLCDLRDGHEEIAAASISQLAAWEGTEFRGRRRDFRAAARASWVLLQHRLLILRTDNAKDSSSRQSARAQAMTLLEQLAKDRPDLRSRVFGLLFRSTDRDVPLDKLETVALKAIIQQAMTQALQPRGASRSIPC